MNVVLGIISELGGFKQNIYRPQAHHSIEVHLSIYISMELIYINIMAMF